MNVNKELLEILPNLHLLDKEVNASIRLEEDLYIYGDDAIEFMNEYEQKFNIDLSDFNFSVYFSEEPYFFNVIYYKLFPSRKKKVRTLTLGDLEKGIEHGRLDDEIISST